MVEAISAETADVVGVATISLLFYLAVDGPAETGEDIVRQMYESNMTAAAGLFLYATIDAAVSDGSLLAIGVGAVLLTGGILVAITHRAVYGSGGSDDADGGGDGGGSGIQFQPRAVDTEDDGDGWRFGPQDFDDWEVDESGGDGQ